MGKNSDYRTTAELIKGNLTLLNAKNTIFSVVINKANDKTFWSIKGGWIAFLILLIFSFLLFLFMCTILYCNVIRFQLFVMWKWIKIILIIAMILLFGAIIALFYVIIGNAVMNGGC